MNNAFDINYLIQSIPAIAKGIPVSLAITVISFIFGLVIGLTTALIRLYRPPFFFQLAQFYVSFIRGTPLLIQLFLAYYGLPILIKLIDSGNHFAQLPSIYFVYFTFAINCGAYLSETFRAAINAIPKGQMEAGYSIGLTTRQSLYKIVLPQAFVIALPNLGNHFIMLLKESSLAFLVAVPEIMGQAKIIAGRTSQFFEVYIVAALIYWLICFIAGQLLILLEKKLTYRNQ